MLDKALGTAQACCPDKEADPAARSFWSLGWEAAPGEHRFAVRATDAAGHVQPERPRPNVDGYANHSIHRVAVTVGEP